MKKIRLISVFVVLTMLLSVCCAVSAQEKITFKFAHIAPVVHADQRAALHFKEYVESKSNGRVEVSDPSCRTGLAANGR